MITSAGNECNEVMTAVLVVNNISRDICNTDSSYNDTTRAIQKVASSQLLMEQAMG